MVTSATHIFDDLTFIESFPLFLQGDVRRDTRKVLVTLYSVYLCGFLFAATPTVLASITISHDAFVTNRLLYVRHSESGLSQLR